jgi:hypothetical protein
MSVIRIAASVTNKNHLKTYIVLIMAPEALRFDQLFGGFFMKPYRASQ